MDLRGGQWISEHLTDSASQRQTHHTKSSFTLASEVPSHMTESVLDVWNAYHTVPFKEEDRDKLTFITPWGRYHFLKAPQGFIASGDGYTHRDSIISSNIKNKVTLVDDTLIWD